MSRQTPELRYRTDPRLYQIVTLSGLLIYGRGWLDFDITVPRSLILIATALLTQFFCTKAWKLPTYDPKSALISGLSLCLLLRTNDTALAMVTAAITIASKFVLRWNGRHLFNPTNFGIVTAILCTGNVWVSPAQWGNVAFIGFLMACLGGLVVNRASRSDVTYAFLGFYLAILFGRAVWLGQPMAIPLHMLQNGGFLLFAFFMISDPKTTPDSRPGRILFALLVAAGAGIVHFALYRTNGLLWSLALFSAATPLMDHLLPGTKYEWRSVKDGWRYSIAVMTEKNQNRLSFTQEVFERGKKKPIGANRAVSAS